MTLPGNVMGTVTKYNRTNILGTDWFCNKITQTIIHPNKGNEEHHSSKQLRAVHPVTAIKKNLNQHHKHSI